MWGPCPFDSCMSLQKETVSREWADIHSFRFYCRVSSCLYLKVCFGLRCPAPSDGTVTVLSNGQDLDSDFKLTVFDYVGVSSADIYLHCQVSLCIKAKGCVPVNLPPATTCHHQTPFDVLPGHILCTCVWFFVFFYRPAAPHHNGGQALDRVSTAAQDTRFHLEM